MINWQTGDIIKVKGKAYEVWEKGDNNLILRSLCDRHYFLTLHNTSPYLVLYADDELDAFQLAIKTYGGNGDGR